MKKILILLVLLFSSSVVAEYEDVYNCVPYLLYENEPMVFNTLDVQTGKIKNLNSSDLDSMEEFIFRFQIIEDPDPRIYFADLFFGHNTLNKLGVVKDGMSDGQKNALKRLGIVNTNSLYINTHIAPEQFFASSNNNDDGRDVMIYFTDNGRAIHGIAIAWFFDGQLSITSHYKNIVREFTNTINSLSTCWKYETEFICDLPTRILP